MCFSGTFRSPRTLAAPLRELCRACWVWFSEALWSLQVLPEVNLSFLGLSRGLQLLVLPSVLGVMRGQLQYQAFRTNMAKQNKNVIILINSDQPSRRANLPGGPNFLKDQPSWRTNLPGGPTLLKTNLPGQPTLLGLSGCNKLPWRSLNLPGTLRK